jgi:aromatic-L-amino-acid decarboxylase
MRRAVSTAAAAPYLTSNQTDRAVNLSEYSLALGRRFRSLKLWFVLRSHGRAGIEAIVRRHLKAAQEVAAQISGDANFELAAPVLFSLVCFRYRGSNEENQALLDRINASGEALLSSTVLNGRLVLRMAIGNAGTTEEDVRAVWKLIRELSRDRG